jgi:hypothetical protein
MVDSIGKVVIVGDYVRYWHNRNFSSTIKSDVGQIVYFDGEFARIKYMDDANDKSCLRSKSGITKLSKEEAMLYVFERGIV